MDPPPPPPRHRDQFSLKRWVVPGHPIPGFLLEICFSFLLLVSVVLFILLRPSCFLPYSPYHLRYYISLHLAVTKLKFYAEEHKNFPSSPSHPERVPEGSKYQFFVLPFKGILCICKQLKKFEREFYISTTNRNSLSLAIKEHSGTKFKENKLLICIYCLFVK